MTSSDEVTNWLLGGDPSVVWQVQRDLLGVPPTTWEATQAQVATQGWGAQLLAKRGADGRWAGGLYSPKWTSTTYTLLQLWRMGLPRDNPDAVAAAVEWVVQLAGSGIMRGIQAPNYLTVSLPIGSPSEIVGVEVVERARGLMGGHAQLDTGDGQVVQGKEVWSISIELAGVPDADSDVAAISSGRIAVVPMRVGDADPDLLAWLRANADLLPEWQPSADDR